MWCHVIWWVNKHWTFVLTYENKFYCVFLFVVEHSVTFVSEKWDTNKLLLLLQSLTALVYPVGHEIIIITCYNMLHLHVYASCYGRLPLLPKHSNRPFSFWTTEKVAAEFLCCSLRFIFTVYFIVLLLTSSSWWKLLFIYRYSNFPPFLVCTCRQENVLPIRSLEPEELRVLEDVLFAELLPGRRPAGFVWQACCYG